MGRWYSIGLGVREDFAKAVEFSRLAAAQNDKNGLCNLGYLYDRGWGVPQNDREALRLYTEAANLGSGQCQFNLGVFYRDGRGTERNPTTAYFWFSLADREPIPNAASRAADMSRLLEPAQRADTDRRLLEWKPDARLRDR